MPRELEESVDPVLDRAKELVNIGQSYTITYLNSLGVLKREIIKAQDSLDLENDDHSSINQSLNNFKSFVDDDVLTALSSSNADAIFTSTVFDLVSGIPSIG